MLKSTNVFTNVLLTALFLFAVGGPL